jgi:hypothetical protein
MKKVRYLIISLVLFCLLSFTSALAQNYSFNLQEGIVDVFLNGDGTARIEYAFTFQNDPDASPIEFVDVAFPSYTDVDISSITATVGDQPVEYISSGEYEGDGSGVAVALGAGSIPPGATGTVRQPRCQLCQYRIFARLLQHCTWHNQMDG